MNFFRHFTVKKTRLPLPAARLSCLYIQRFADMDGICKECLWMKCVFAPKISCSCILLGNKRFVNVLNVNSVPKKIIPYENRQYTSFPLLTLKCCCLPGKLGKHIKFVTIFVYSIDEIKLGAWRAAKTRTCLLRFIRSELQAAFLCS